MGISVHIVPKKPNIEICLGEDGEVFTSWKFKADSDDKFPLGYMFEGAMSAVDLGIVPARVQSILFDLNSYVRAARGLCRVYLFCNDEFDMMLCRDNICIVTVWNDGVYPKAKLVPALQATVRGVRVHEVVCKSETNDLFYGVGRDNVLMIYDSKGEKEENLVMECDPLVFLKQGIYSYCAGVESVGMYFIELDNVAMHKAAFDFGHTVEVCLKFLLECKGVWESGMNYCDVSSLLLNVRQNYDISPELVRAIEGACILIGGDLWRFSQCDRLLDSILQVEKIASGAYYLIQACCSLCMYEHPYNVLGPAEVFKSMHNSTIG